jgi:hypothetical protein
VRLAGVDVITVHDRALPIIHVELATEAVDGRGARRGRSEDQEPLLREGHSARPLMCRHGDRVTGLVDEVVTMVLVVEPARRAKSPCPR